ncbi:MAG TPA: alpha/beta hydrolase [Bryobacteraceae bacterium]|nr:alpha/beta hydrolase [Bryobacteraceae bacterium]
MPRALKRTVYALLVVLLLLAAVIASLVRFDIPVERLRAKYATPPSKFVDVGGLAVHYRDEGQGPAAVLLHGAASSLFTWDAWAADLSKDHRVIRYDLPGFGLTGPNASKDYSMAWHVRFLQEFLDKLNVPSCALAGNSFGGRIAWEFSYAHPERVKKLILVDASGYPAPERRILAMRLARMPVIGPILGHATPRFFVAMTVRQTYGDPSRVTDALIDRYYDMILRAGNRETFGILNRMPTPDLSARIRAIEVPTLILWGAEDQAVPVSSAERFHHDIRNSRVIVYPGAGHIPMEEIPVETVRDARAFLAEP